MDTTKWIVQPFTSFGFLRFGTARHTLRQQLGVDYQSFRKTPNSGSDTDAYKGLGLHLYYDSQDALDYVEAIAARVAPVHVGDIQLLGRPIAELLADMATNGHNATRDRDLCFFATLGISIYVPDGRTVASVGVFSRSGFDAFLALQQKIAERRRRRAIGGAGAVRGESGPVLKDGL